MNLSTDFFSPHIKENIVWVHGKEKRSYPKSPLRYPGGKARAVSIILSLIPADTEILVSPFFGGGSIEIASAFFGVKVLGFDIFDPLVAFWQELLSNPTQLADEALKYYPLDKSRFYALQKAFPTTKLEIAAQFFVLNRASFSGATLSGGMSPGHPRFTQSSINYLRNFYLPNLTVQKQDFKLTLMYEDGNFFYLDPPYLIESSLYGRKGSTHKGFDHHNLWQMLKKRSKWILSYNNCEEIRELYKGFRILYPEWKYGMSSNKASKEVIILSNDIPEIIGGCSA
ncbi:MAG: DNA adenine methylase [Dehalobacter sp.]|nr:DNA adenine methylase [Dehalobacter sp.]